MKLNRREFLQKGLIGATVLALSPTVFLQNPQPRKIIVIGAGLSGLAAGYELSKLGHDVTILEAQKRPGGRILTVREPFAENMYAEAGAARIHKDHDLTHKYIREFNLPLAPFYPKSGKFVRFWEGKREEVGWGKFEDAMFFLMTLEDEDKWRKIRGGNDALPLAFAAKLASKIRYDAPVVKIEQNENSVTVKFNEKGKIESLAADFLICALPFTLLRKIEIEPKFSPAKQQIIEKLPYDSASRVLLQMKKKFWLEKKLNGFAVSENMAEIWDSTFQQNSTHGILQSYLRGEASLNLQKLPETERVRATVNELEKIFPGASAQFEQGLTKCWSEDAWVLGAWAHPNPKENEIIRRAENRIFFAGEHASDWASWMQGALESANRVVEEISRFQGLTAKV